MSQWMKKSRCSPHIHKKELKEIFCSQHHLRLWRAHVASRLRSHFWIHEVEEGDWEYLAEIEADEPCLTKQITTLYD